MTAAPYPPLPPCGHTEPESDWRDPDTGKHRAMRCEGGRLVSRGNGLDSFTDGTMWINGRRCRVCDETWRVHLILSAESEDTRI